MRTATTSIVCAMLLLVAAGTINPVSADSYMSNSWYYPIISSANGSGGTRWQTEFSITNPQGYNMKLTLRVAINGQYKTYTLTVPAGETYFYSDFLKQAFNLSGNAALYITAEAEDNGNRDRDCLEFVTSNRIYNTGGGSGTYGQEVPPADVFEGFLGSSIAYFTGIKNYGRAGVDGFRANLGFWHTGYSDETVKARLYDVDGDKVWEQTITVERHNPKVISVGGTVQGGVLVIDPMGEYVDCSFYVSIVDNKTGDGALRTMIKGDADDLAACGAALKCDQVAADGYDPTPLTREEAADRLHWLITGDHR